MIRNHEKPLAMRAGLMTLLVHTVLCVILIFSFNWKSIQPMQIATVELWDQLPSAKPEPQPVEHVKQVEVEKPIAPEPLKVEPEAPAKVEIQIKKTSEKEIAKKPEKVEKVKAEPNKNSQKSEDDLKKLQDSILNEDVQLTKQEKPKAAAPSPPAEIKSTVAVTGSTTDTSEMAKYIGLIAAQIKEHVNHEVCGNSKTELQFVIQLMPTGMLIGKPQLKTSNASSACNDAVERAILQAQPMPVPKGDLFNQFRLLQLKFRPNE